MPGFLRALARWYDPHARPRSREELLAVVFVHLVALMVAARTVALAVKPVVRRLAPPMVPADKPGERFGVKDEVRKKIFEEFATNEPSHRQQGKASFPTETWSAEDHRASFERFEAANIASRYGLSLTQVYLILDEGIREHWLGPDGKPLSPKTVPLKPRRKY